MRLNRHRCGFSLVELVTSLTIISILLVAMGSAIVIAARGLPDPTSPLAEKVDAAEVVRELANEVTYATAVLTASPTELEFVVNRNGAPTTISYSWSGTPGDPLVRQYDAGTPVNVLDSVQQFNLDYELGSEAIVVAALPVEGVEIELAKYPTASVSTAFQIQKKNWIGQYFQITLPADTISWRVTRLVFRAMEDGPANGQTLVQLRLADDITQLPTNTILEQSTMVEADLTPSMTWREFAFSNVVGLSLTDHICLVLEWVTSKNSAVIEYDTAPSGRLTTSDAGANWNVDSGNSMLYYLYGKVTLGEPDLFPLRLVKISLDAGTLEASPLYTAASLLNEPGAP